MAQTIEDVESRTVLQQFHSLYKKQTETDKNVKNLDTKIEQEKSDRQTADANLRNDMNTNTNKIEYNTTQITALKSDKQDKLTAGTNITIDTNNVISASGGLTKVAASDVDSEQATQGQVLTADGSGGASWQNASGGDTCYKHNFRIYTTTSNNLQGYIYITLYLKNVNTTITNYDYFRYYSQLHYSDLAVGGYVKNTSTNKYYSIAFISDYGVYPTIVYFDENDEWQNLRTSISSVTDHVFEL